MTRKIHLNDAAMRLPISNSRTVVLLDRLGKEQTYGREECARNIYLLDDTLQIIWQVRSKFDADGGPFTNIVYEKQNLRGYRWDGGKYDIDLDTGEARPLSLTK